MSSSTALERLTRRLDIIGGMLLAAALAGFVWAIGFTVGVDGLIEGLVIAGFGLFVPGIAMLWVSWIIGGAGHDDPVTGPAPSITPRERFAQRLRNYSLAALCVGVAAGARAWLTPYMGPLDPFSTFLLAVTVAAWIGGMGPAVFAAALSVPVSWKLFLEASPPSTAQAAELIGAGLFIAVALGIGGITAALRLTQLRAAALRAEIAHRQALLDEAEARFRSLADRSSSMIWTSDAARQWTFFSKAWYAFAGRSPDTELGDGWIAALHPEDREHAVLQLTKAHDVREAFTIEYRLRRQDGTYRRVQDSGIPRFHSEGRFAGFEGERIDVTDMPLALRSLARGRSIGARIERSSG